MSRNRLVRVVAAIAMVAVTLSGARAAEAAGELTVTTTIMTGSPLAPADEVRRNQPVTIRVVVTNTTAAEFTFGTPGLALTTTGLEGTAVISLPPTVPATTPVEIMITGFNGSMSTVSPTVSATATVNGTFPDASVATLPVDADTDPDPATAAGVSSAVPLVDFSVNTTLRRGTARALHLIAGEPVTVRVTILSDMTTPITIPVGGVVITKANLTGTASNTSIATVPARPAAGPDPFDIDIPGFVAGPGTPATASAVVSGTVGDNIIKPNDAGPEDDPVTANDTATPASVPVSAITVTTELATPGTPPTPADSFFAGAPVTVQVILTTNLPQPLTIGAGDVVLTTSNLGGTAAPSPLTLISAGPQVTTINITGLTAGPGTPARASAVVNGLLPDGTLSPTDGNTDPVSANNTATPGEAPVVSPVFTFTGNPLPSAGRVDRGSTVVVTATVTNPVGAPTIIGGTFIITVSDKTTITATPAGSTTLLNTVTSGSLSIDAGETRSVEVSTQVKTDAAKVPGDLNDFTYSATFVSVSLAAPLATADLSYEIRPTADIQMVVTAPETEVRDPSRADVDVDYRVTNTGPDTATGISFVATAPAGFVGGPPSVTEGADWNCGAVPASDNISCIYGPSLAKDAFTTTVTIRWRFNTVGTKTFSATASSTTEDPAAANNTASDTTEVVNPTSTVSIVSADATPDPVIVAIDKDADIDVDYVIRNSGNRNLIIRATLTAPAGSTLVSLSGSGGTTCDLVAATCDVQVNKNDGEVTIEASYSVPQASFVGSQASFSATITALDGGALTDPDSVTTLSDFVVGVPPTIDIGLAPPAVDADALNVDFGVLPSETAIAIPVTFRFQNFSPDFPIRATTATLELTLPAGESIDLTALPGGCTVVPASSPVRLTCPVAEAVPAGSPGTRQVTLTFLVKTAEPVAITARLVVTDPGNRIIFADPDPAANPDVRGFTIDINRRPKPADEIGPSVPVGGVFDYTPIGGNALHEDMDIGDTPKIAALDAGTTLACPGVAPTACVVEGGTVTGVTYGVNNDTTMKLTLAGGAIITPTVAGGSVTATINYTVTDGKSSVPSSVKVRFVAAVTAEVPGSFGTPPETPPRSFGFDVGVDRTSSTPSPIEVLEDDLGETAAGTAFPADRTYTVLSADASTLNVVGSTLSLLPTTGSATAVQYTPAPAYTSDQAIVEAVGDAAPPDSFKYKTVGKKGVASLYTVEIPASVAVRNQNPIGIDSPFDVPNGVTQTVFPADNDIDGNTIEDPVAVKSPVAKTFIFDDEGELNPAIKLRIQCIGPMPPAADLDAFLAVTTPEQVCSTDTTVAAAPGWKRAGETLTLGTVEVDRGTATAKLANTGDDAFRAVTLTADATVRGELDFVYIVVDNYGGASFAKATVKVPNTPPQVIEGVRTVLKNTPTIVVDTRLAAQDVNNDDIVVSGTSERTLHGTTKIGDNNRTITYTPDRDYLGPDKLLYNVSDGRADGAASAELQLNVIEQPGAITDAGTGGSGSGAGGSAGGNLAATGGDPLPLTAAAGASLVLGLALVQAGRRRQSLPLLERARHLRT